MYHKLFDNTYTTEQKLVVINNIVNYKKYLKNEKTVTIWWAGDRHVEVSLFTHEEG